MKTITQKRLKELLRYDRHSGKFYWRIARGGRKVGDETGCVSTFGYVMIGLDHQVFLAHRLAWLYVTGKFPINDIAAHIQAGKKHYGEYFHSAEKES